MDRKGKGKNIVITSVYGTEKWENLEEVINRIMESYKEDYIIIGGDFNARIGEGVEEGGEEVGDFRRSKDRNINSIKGERFDKISKRNGGQHLEWRNERG